MSDTNSSEGSSSAHLHPLLYRLPPPLVNPFENEFNYSYSFQGRARDIRDRTSYYPTGNADCEFHIELFTGGIDVDRSRVEASLEEGELGIAMEYRRRQEMREQLVRSYQHQKKYEEEKLQKIKEIWFDKFGAPSSWRRWEE
ncbi:hypothetical protein TorRG33x02_241910 [Trema orientale]|uniref:Uncharacterized protein n=1 Tax=Trema orientale TaxID=63057 RepID=A0A2P5DTX6_TREOI|nr:hypothetical protein TorRG33x02_241910 [Trema orientale]